VEPPRYGKKGGDNNGDACLIRKKRPLQSTGGQTRDREIEKSSNSRQGNRRVVIKTGKKAGPASHAEKSSFAKGTTHRENKRRDLPRDPNAVVETASPLERERSKKERGQLRPRSPKEKNCIGGKRESLHGAKKRMSGGCLKALKNPYTHVRGNV